MGAKGKSEKWLEPENLTLIQGWRRDGLSDEQVAKNIGIQRSTLYEWLKKYKDFSDAYKKGTETSLYEVENAMYKAAVGYDVEEVEMIETIAPDGGVTTQKRKRRRHIPPNVGAACFILKNKKKDAWKDRPLDDGAGSHEPIVIEMPGEPV